MIDSAALKTAINESAKEAFETMVFLPIEQIPDQPDSPEPVISLICTISLQVLIAVSFPFAVIYKAPNA